MGTLEILFFFFIIIKGFEGRFERTVSSSMMDRNRELIQLEPGKRKSADHWA